MKKFKQIIRGFNRNKLNTSVIVLSLALGIACFFLIGIFIQREFKPDSFNPDKNRTFALQCDDPFSGGVDSRMMHCRFGSAEYMLENFEEVESICRLWYNSGKRTEANRNIYSDEPIVLTASTNFFSFFNYRLISNNHETVLKTQNDIVISEELALKYFGEALPIGESLKITYRNGDKEYFVS
ncbi:MAG: ABC transporter permease, partial [Draconibacterium sp.]|nr:ABC transporter permease [Draconibacterium sp.]